MNFAWIKRNFLLISIIILGVEIFLHSLTLSYSPPHWRDDVHITEIAQGGIGCKDSDWSVNIFKPNGDLPSQSWAVFYLGGLCSELGYKSIGHTGPRVIPLAILVLSAFVLYLYLFRKTNDKYTSALITLIYASFPHMVQSVRGGRFDVLAMLFLFLSLYALTFRNTDKTNISFWRCALCGAFYMASVFSWATALLCAPLILFEIYDGCNGSGSFPYKKFFATCAWCAFGSLCALLIIMVPFLANFSQTMEGFKFILAQNSGAENLKIDFIAVISFITALPGVYLIGIILSIIFVRRTWILTIGIAMFLSVSLIRVYVFKILYLLPYMLILMSIALSELKQLQLKKIARVVLVLILGYCLMFSVVFRNVVSFILADYLDYNQIAHECEKRIGRNVKIYSDSFQLYYVGRDLGWKQFYVDKNKDIISRYLSGVDYYVANGKIPDFKLKLLNALNFDLVDEIMLTPPKYDTAAINKLIDFVHKKFPQYEYGPYYIYKRKTSQKCMVE